MPKSKTSAVLSLLLVFVSGALVGVLAHRAYTLNKTATASTGPRKLGPADWRKRNLAEMKTRLKLDDQQAARLDEIFNQVDDDFRQLRTKRIAEDHAVQSALVDKINAILRPDQQLLYQQLRDEREKERERRRQQMQKQGGPGGPPPGPPPDKK